MSSTLAASGSLSFTLQEKASSEVNLSKTTTVGSQAERAASSFSALLSGVSKHATARRESPAARPLSSAAEASFRAAEAPTATSYPALAKARSRAAVRTPAAEECGSGQTVERKSTDFFFVAGEEVEDVGVGVGDSSAAADAAAAAADLFRVGVAPRGADASRLALEGTRPEGACIGG